MFSSYRFLIGSIMHVFGRELRLSHMEIFMGLMLFDGKIRRKSKKKSEVLIFHICKKENEIQVIGITTILLNASMSELIKLRFEHFEVPI